MMSPGACSCGFPLSLSVYLLEPLVKSCSYCSHAAGEHVYHPLADFGLWHAYEGKAPIPQSECVRAYRARTEGQGDFQPEGTRCVARAALGAPRRPANPAVAELLEPLAREMLDLLAAEHPVGRRVSTDGAGPAGSPRPCPRVRREAAPDPTVYRFDPGCTPRPYDQGEHYRAGERVDHPAFGICLVLLVDRGRVVVACAGDSPRRILVHGRGVEVLPEVLELAREYGEPMSARDAAAYAGINHYDAVRQLDALVRAGELMRVGFYYERPRARKETAA